MVECRALRRCMRERLAAGRREFLLDETSAMTNLDQLRS